MIQECYLAEGLERVFRAIHEERIAGLPILNPALQVPVDFRPLRSHCAGILITPMVHEPSGAAAGGRQLGRRRAGQAAQFRFPLGACEMAVYEEEMLGRNLSHSLFSPMGAFAGQQQAVAATVSILERMMTPIAETLPAHQPEPGRRALLRGLFAVGRG